MLHKLVNALTGRTSAGRNRVLPGASKVDGPPCRRLPAGWFLAAAAAIVLAAPCRADNPQGSVIVIDSATSLPVATGIVPPSNTGDIIVFAEGALRGPVLNQRFEEGWFGPAGQDHYDGSGQPIIDGMPYGALIGGTVGDPAQFQFLGRMGAFSLQPIDVGHQFRLSLNLSATDMASFEGQLTVTVIYLPDGSADVGKFVINPSTPLPLLTGMVAQTGDQFIVLPRGRLRDPLLTNSVYTDGNFGPEGLLGLLGTAQPNTGGPYGALYGNFDPVGSDFYIGDGGCWSAQPVDVGQELKLTLNTDAVSQAGMSGKFVVYVFRVAAPDPAGVQPGGDPVSMRAFAAPNPVREATSIRFGLAASGPVRLRVYDAQGRSVRSLVNETLPAGAHTVGWDRRDDRGGRVPSGAYFYQLNTQGGSDTGRVVLVD